MENEWTPDVWGEATTKEAAISHLAEKLARAGLSGQLTKTEREALVRIMYCRGSSGTFETGLHIVTWRPYEDGSSRGRAIEYRITPL